MTKNYELKCHFHDFICPLELPYCGMCEHNPPDEEKPNGKKQPVPRSFFCPSCGEVAYSNECCVFCGQHFIQGDEEMTYEMTDEKEKDFDIDELDLFDMLDEEEEE